MSANKFAAWVFSRVALDEIKISNSEDPVVSMIRKTLIVFLYFGLIFLLMVVFILYLPWSRNPVVVLFASFAGACLVIFRFPLIYSDSYIVFNLERNLVLGENGKKSAPMDEIFYRSRKVFLFYPVVELIHVGKVFWVCDLFLERHKKESFWHCAINTSKNINKIILHKVGNYFGKTDAKGPTV